MREFFWRWRRCAITTRLARSNCWKDYRANFREIAFIHKSSLVYTRIWLEFAPRPPEARMTARFALLAALVLTASPAHSQVVTRAVALDPNGNEYSIGFGFPPTPGA